MQFTQIEVNANGTDYVFKPYDRGAAGAFVWKQNAASAVHAPRLIVTMKANDNSSDKSIVQQNVPRTCPSTDNCAVDVLMGTDLVKTELRFLATTEAAARTASIDLHIALLQELRDTIADRDVIYS